jgi:20S proteasome alpha/beta subunit
VTRESSDIFQNSLKTLRKTALNMQLKSTLIVAITCKDGIVFASDGLAATLIGGNLIKSEFKKIFKLGNNRLWACSGNARDITEFWSALSKILIKTKNCPLTESRLNKHLEKIAQEIKAKAQITQFGPRCPEYLVVGHHEYPMIWHVANNCESVFFSKDQHELTKCSMFSIGTGVGQQVARIVFERVKGVCSEYTLTLGSLIACRVLRDAIKASPLIGEPIEIWTISDNEVKLKSNAELKELKILSDKWEDKERRLSEDFLSSIA